MRFAWRHDCHEIRFHSICPQRLQFKVMFKRNFCFGFVHSVLEIWQRLDWPSPSLNTPLNSFKPSNLFSTLPFVFLCLCSRSFNSIQQLELHVLMSWYKVNFSIWTKYLTSIQWWCFLLGNSWSTTTTSAKTDIFYYWFVTDTDIVCLFVWNIWILNFSAWGGLVAPYWWPWLVMTKWESPPAVQHQQQGWVLSPPAVQHQSHLPVSCRHHHQSLPVLTLMYISVLNMFWEGVC